MWPERKVLPSLPPKPSEPGTGITVHFILSRSMCVSIDGVWIGKWIYWHLYTWLETTSNYSATANLHNSQITTAPDKPFPACYLHQPLPGKGSKSGDSSASCAEVLSSQTPVQNWLVRTNCLQYNSSARTTWKHPVSNSTSIVARRYVYAGTCLPSSFPETALVYLPISRSLHSNGFTRYNSIILAVLLIGSIHLQPVRFINVFV
jgi:hypothetical protein